MTKSLEELSLKKEIISILQYMNEDNGGGFQFSTAIDVNYDLLTNYGLDPSWCSETDGYGYMLFSGGSLNQLPKTIKIILPENASQYIIYSGTGSARN